MSTPNATSVLTDNPTLTDFAFERPTVDDGADMWRLAKATGVLDLNSSYAYLMWCRDFADTSIVARRDGELAGFVTGFIRPSAPAALMVWQVATAAKFRGQGIAATMLHELFQRCEILEGVTSLETTITADNPASIGLFTAFAAHRGMPVGKEALFEGQAFPDAHDTEYLYRIGSAN